MEQIDQVIKTYDEQAFKELMDRLLHQDKDMYLKYMRHVNMLYHRGNKDHEFRKLERQMEKAKNDETKARETLAKTIHTSNDQMHKRMPNEAMNLIEFTMHAQEILNSLLYPKDIS
jgi:thiaminase